MLSEFVSFYVEWQGVRKDLKGQEARLFERWLARTRPELVRAASSPAAFRLQCIEIKRMFVPRQEQRIGLVTLALYAEQLIRAYRSQHRVGTYQAFLSRALVECSTKQALEQFIKRESSK